MLFVQSTENRNNAQTVQRRVQTSAIVWSKLKHTLFMTPGLMRFNMLHLFNTLYTCQKTDFCILQQLFNLTDPFRTMISLTGTLNRFLDGSLIH